MGMSSHRFTARKEPRYPLCRRLVGPEPVRTGTEKNKSHVTSGVQYYEGLSIIFRTDAVKVIKLTISPIGRHHPRSSSLPHVDTGPTVSSIFGTLPGSHFVSVSSTLCDWTWISSMVSNRRPFSCNFILGNRKSHREPNQGSTVGGG
jgi:hypothetical protein